MNFILTHTPLLYLTQSFWRDEAFSIFYASQSFLTILSRSVLEPPFYNILLHFWIKTFGTTEIAARSLSLVAYTLSIIILLEWASKKFKSKFLQHFIPLLFAVNPMVIYYAFEVRAYAWYLCFFILSFVAYDMKQWKLFATATLLAFFTHYYTIIFTFFLVVHYAMTHTKTLRSVTHIMRDRFFQSIIVIMLLSLPQIIRIFLQLTTVHESWYYPVDLHLIYSVLGNMFVGFEGTPWFLWPITAGLSVVLLATMIIPLITKKTRPLALPALAVVILPLFSIIGISFFKPYFVNRYLIPVTFGQILLVAYSISLISIRKLKIVTGIILILILLGFNSWYPRQHKKTDFRSALTLANFIQKEHDYIYAEDALNFFETLYYAKDRATVRLYNPTNAPFMTYIGASMFSPSYNTAVVPLYPAKAILIKKDGTVGILMNVPPMYKN